MSGTIDVVNFTPIPPNPLLVDYESSRESGDEQKCPSRDADAAVFDFGAKFGGDEMTQDETKPVEKKEFRFKNLTEQSDLDELSKKTFSANMDRKIDWAVGLFISWR